MVGRLLSNLQKWAHITFGLTKSIAQCGSKYRMCCIRVSPGLVLTRAAIANMKARLDRAAEQQEIADVCLFLASDKGQFVYGKKDDRWW